MSDLLDTMKSLKATFDKYAGEDGDKLTLSKKELTQLIKDELLCDSAPTDEIEEFFKMLDENGDGVVDYNEYVTFVTSFCVLLQE